ncbi:MAG: FHA domain-containing protein [Thermoleophilia bacterium]
MDIGVWALDPADRIQIREADAHGLPYLVLRDGEGVQRILPLRSHASALAIGRDRASEVAIPWDDRVSRTHAQLVRVGASWSVEDQGLSRNGTFVNEERITARRRLHHGDVVRVGHTTVMFRAPGETEAQATAPEVALVPPRALSPGQRKVLQALCRPCLAPGGPHAPASNDAIAAELHLSVDAVKAHLRMLFRRFDIEDLPQIQKRTALVRLAVEAGALRDE